MDNLLNKAKTILESNWKDTFSIPAANLYPFQWNWDSCFVAMGHSHYELSKSIDEMNALFTGQWKNGMLPHIIFHSENEKSYFPNYDFWETNVNNKSSQKPKTSGITQPPVYGVVLEYIYNANKNDEKIKAFVKDIYPKMIKANEFLYNYRDPHNEGLFFIYHPWESGRDNSPIWDKSLERIIIKPGDISSYTRRDTNLADPSERPTKEQYDRYVYLLELGKKHKYENKTLIEETPFAIQDVMMNALLLASNDSLIRIGKDFRFDTRRLEEWQSESKRNFKSKFWNDDLQFFCSYDMVSKHFVDYREIGGLISLFAKVVDDEQVVFLSDYLRKIHNKGFLLCPSFDIDSPLFDSKRYWRGPIWSHMNWMIQEGLRYYNHDELADIITKDTFDIVNRQGFYEYYEPEKVVSMGLNNGYGGKNFSWTASTIITLLNNKK